MDLYDFEKTKSMSLLEANKSRIAVTTDMWTSGNQKKGFMVVTAHFIDESWVLQNRIIRYPPKLVSMMMFFLYIFFLIIFQYANFCLF